MTGVGVTLTITFIFAVFALPRKYAALAFVAAVLYITQGQAVELMGINMMAIRFVEFAAAIRVLVRQEHSTVQLTPSDKWLIILVKWNNSKVYGNILLSKNI